MYIETNEKFNILHSESNCSLYDASLEQIYKDSYFFKIAYLPKTSTLQQAIKDFKQILDSDIEKLPIKQEHKENGTAN